MLQGTRRTFSKEPAPFVRAIAESAPFFVRPFSTSAQRPVAFISRWLLQRQRLVSFEDERPVAPYFLALGRYRVQPRVEFRGKINFVAKPTAMMLGSALDARFLRAKSPRSQQYVLRLSAGAIHISKQEKITKLATFHRLRSVRALPFVQERWVRSRRRYFFHQHTPQEQFVAPQATLAKSRGMLLTRYTLTTVRARRSVTAWREAKAAQHNFPNRKVTVSTTHWLKRRSRRLIRQTQHYHPLREMAPEAAGLLIAQARGTALQTGTTRSILQARVAAHRTQAVQYKAGLVLPNNAAGLPAYLRARLRRWEARFQAPTAAALSRRLRKPTKAPSSKKRKAALRKSSIAPRVRFRRKFAA